MSLLQIEADVKEKKNDGGGGWRCYRIFYFGWKKECVVFI